MTGIAHCHPFYKIQLLNRHICYCCGQIFNC